MIVRLDLQIAAGSDPVYFAADIRSSHAASFRVKNNCSDDVCARSLNHFALPLFHYALAVRLAGQSVHLNPQLLLSHG